MLESMEELRRRIAREERVAGLRADGHVSRPEIRRRRLHLMVVALLALVGLAVTTLANDLWVSFRRNAWMDPEVARITMIVAASALAACVLDKEQRLKRLTTLGRRVGALRAATKRPSSSSPGRARSGPDRVPGVGRRSVISFDPLLGGTGARAVVRLAERFGRYGMYSQEDAGSQIGRGLTQRHDAVLNYLRSGGLGGEREPADVAAARTNYFREEYAYGTRPCVDGIEPFLFHEGLTEAARELHGRDLVEPAIVFANVMVPGQELALHTDVPEFRGVNRKQHPQWLLVAMRHSGLFEEWRMPIATGVAWFHDGHGGDFVFYPDGADRPRVAHPIAFDTALLLDTDTVFHGVDRVDAPDPLPPLRPGMCLEHAGDGEWVVIDGARVVARYRWDQLRFSVSWKAYCFADAAERDAWRAHTTDLDLGRVLGRLVDDLRERGRIAAGPVPPARELALVIIDEYIRFPEATGPSRT